MAEENQITAVIPVKRSVGRPKGSKTKRCVPKRSVVFFTPDEQVRAAIDAMMMYLAGNARNQHQGYMQSSAIKQMIREHPMYKLANPPNDDFLTAAAAPEPKTLPTPAELAPAPAQPPIAVTDTVSAPLAPTPHKSPWASPWRK